MKNKAYKESILKLLQPSVSDHASYAVNLQDENPTVVIGPMVEKKDESSPPFYISLNIHDKMLHNCLLDSGASHNLMPKKVMDELGLEMTKPYHDLYSLDSKRVKCLGVIKDLVVSLTQLPMISLVMDIVVADIPPKFGMLFSISWLNKLGGTLQMDMSYATIPVFGGESRRLYRETQLAYIVSDGKNPANHPVYAIDQDLGACILQIDDSVQNFLQVKRQVSEKQQEDGRVRLWRMYFDGSSSREGAGAGVVLISPSKEVTTL